MDLRCIAAIVIAVVVVVVVRRRHGRRNAQRNRHISDSLSPSPEEKARQSSGKMAEDKSSLSQNIPPGALAALTEIHKASYDFVKALVEGVSARSTCVSSSGCEGGATADSSLARELRTELYELKKVREEMIEEMQKARAEREMAKAFSQEAKKTVGELKSVLEGFQTLQNSFSVNVDAVNGVVEQHRLDTRRILTAVANLQNAMHDKHTETMTKMKDLIEQDKQLRGSGSVVTQDAEEGSVGQIENTVDTLMRQVCADGGHLNVKREQRTPSATPLRRFDVSPLPGPTVKRENSVRRSLSRISSPRRNNFHKACLWCTFCRSKDHQPVDCWKVPFLSDRRNLMRKMNRCRICLKNHRGDCKSNETCMFCNRTSHNSSLCESSRHMDHLNRLPK